MMDDFKKFKANLLGNPRFCNIDESLYGSRGLTRILTNPSIQASVTLAFAASAIEILLSPQIPVSSYRLLLLLGTNSWVLPFAHAFNRIYFWLTASGSKNWAIDRRASVLGDHKATHTIREAHFKSAGYQTYIPVVLTLFEPVAFIVGVSLIVSGVIKLPPHHVSHIRARPVSFGSGSISDIGLFLESAFALPAVIACFPLAIRSMRVANKLSQGKWVVRTNPPKPKPKEKGLKSSTLVKMDL